MPKKGDVHVIQRDDLRWAVEVEGKGRADSKHGTQGDAIKRGRQVARGNSSELLVHGRDGKIRERNTYGRDPRNIRG